VLRAKAELDYPDMAEKSHYTMRTLASAAGGLRLPTLPVLIAYVQACDGDVSEWEDRWARLAKSKKGAAALPAAGEQATDHAPAADKDPAGPQARAQGEPQGQPQSSEVYVITSAKPRDERWLSWRIRANPPGPLPSRAGRRTFGLRRAESLVPRDPAGSPEPLEAALAGARSASRGLPPSSLAPPRGPRPYRPGLPASWTYGRA
jgi:hypothetical protein